MEGDHGRRDMPHSLLGPQGHLCTDLWLQTPCRLERESRFTHSTDYVPILHPCSLWLQRSTPAPALPESPPPTVGPFVVPEMSRTEHSPTLT